MQKTNAFWLHVPFKTNLGFRLPKGSALRTEKLEYSEETCENNHVKNTEEHVVHAPGLPRGVMLQHQTSADLSLPLNIGHNMQQPLETDRNCAHNVDDDLKHV